MNRKNFSWVWALVLLGLGGFWAQATELTPVYLRLRTATGSSVDRVTTFEAVDVPAAYSADMIINGKVPVQSVNGEVRTNLVSGNYRITFAGLPKSMTVFVPISTNEVNLALPEYTRSGVTTYYVVSRTGATGSVGTAVSGAGIAATTNEAVVTLELAANLRAWSQLSTGAVAYVDQIASSSNVLWSRIEQRIAELPINTNAGISLELATNVVNGVLSGSSVAYLSQLTAVANAATQRINDETNLLATATRAAINTTSNALVAQIVGGSATNAINNNEGSGSNITFNGTTTFTGDLVSAGAGAGTIGFYNSSGSALVAGWNGSFWYGVAAGLTGLNANSLAVGSVPLARLSGISTNQMDPETDALYRAGANGTGGAAGTNTANTWYQPQTFAGGIVLTGITAIGTVYFETFAASNLVANGVGITNMPRSGIQGLETSLTQLTNAIAALAGGPTNGVSAPTATNIAQTVVAQSGLATTNQLNGTNAALTARMDAATGAVSTALSQKLTDGTNQVVLSETWKRQFGRPNLSNWAAIATSSKLSVGQSIPVPTGDWVGVFTDPYGSANLLEYSDTEGRWVIPGTIGLRVQDQLMAYGLYVESTAQLTGNCDVWANLDVNGASRLTGVVLLDDGPGGATGIQAAGTNRLTLFGPMELTGTTYVEAFQFPSAEIHNPDTGVLKLQDAGWDVDKAVTAAEGYFLPAQTPATWPTAPRTMGEAYFGNSNGVVYLLTSIPGSGQWDKTNLLSSPY